MYNLITAVLCVLLICTTAVGITLLILKFRCAATYIPWSAETPSEDPKVSVEQKTDESTTEQNSEVAQASMDAVIKSVNELMGVTEPDEGDK